MKGIVDESLVMMTMNSMADNNYEPRSLAHIDIDVYYIRGGIWNVIVECVAIMKANRHKKYIIITS